MRLTTGIILSTAALGALVLWLLATSTDRVVTGMTVALGLGLIAMVWFVGAVLRNRQYRRLREMRESALW